MSFLSEILKQGGKKIVEEVVLGVAAGAVIKGVKDHGPDFAKAVAKKTPVAFDAAKDKASAAKRKFGKNKPN